jgi:hypothetical protein
VFTRDQGRVQFSGTGQQKWLPPCASGDQCDVWMWFSVGETALLKASEYSSAALQLNKDMCVLLYSWKTPFPLCFLMCAVFVTKCMHWDLICMNKQSMESSSNHPRHGGLGYDELLYMARARCVGIIMQNDRRCKCVFRILSIPVWYWLSLWV